MNRSGDNLYQLSNADLKLRLDQFGFPNVPVTDTTKPILVKKLQNYLNIERAKLGKATKYAVQFSSDEESDNDIARKNADKHIPRFPNSIFKRTTSSLNRNMPPPLHLDKRSTSNFRNPMVSIITNNFTPQQKLNLRTSSHSPPYQVLSAADENDSDYSSCKYSRVSNNLLPAASNIYNCPPDETISDLSITDTESYSSLHKKNNLVGNQSISNSSRSNNSSPCVSDFTRRLLNLRTETMRNSNVLKRKELQCDSNSDTLHTTKKNSVYRHEVTLADNRSIELNISPSTAFSNLLNKLDEQYGSKQTIIPYVLVGLFSIFFSLLALMYLTITPDLANTLSETSTRFNYCNNRGSETNLQLSSSTCIDNGSLESALQMIKLMVPVLQSRAEEHHCISTAKPYKLSAKEVLNLMQTKDKTYTMRKIMKDLQNAEYLIEKNPQWNIKHVDFNGNLLNFNDVVRMRNTQAIYFAVLNPQLPLSCLIYNKMQKVFCIIGVLGIIVLVAGAIYTGYKIVLIYYKSKREIINYFIEEIINILIKNANDPNQSSIFVNHLRDKLIPLHKRKKLEWAWEQAIKYLQENESRLQFEMKIINGEDCKIIKWTDTTPIEHYPQTTQYKKWQSPAFDNSNKIINPPTSCLKIRQMFDKFEAYDPNLKTIIQDAILEKVGGKCKIYDIQLDKQTCCVYVRCASEKDAGIVHNEINGWWFDKRLVSIKFLRVERYLNRFVESSTGPAYLSPSNAKNLSMTQCSKPFSTISNAEQDNSDIAS